MTKVTTEPCRLSFEHLFQPKAVQPGQDAKYSATILIPKTDTITVKKIQDAIAAETREKWPTTVPPTLKRPLKDGDGMLGKDGKQRPECVGMYVINSTSSTQPGLVDFTNGNAPIMSKEVLYSGCYCRFQLAFAPYDKPTSKGIGAYLNNVQKVKDGPSLVGRQDPTEAFNDGWTPPQVNESDM